VENLIFRQFFDSVSSTYTYIVADPKGHEACLIDPVIDHVPAYVQWIDECGLRLVYAIDTHTHADHVTGAGRLRDLTDCATAIGTESPAECVTLKICDGETIRVGSLHLRAIHTPGHTDDSYSFLLPDRVFTGDILLIRGSGRTDFQNGDPYQAYDSLFNKLLRLPDPTMVYPAHDYRGWTMSTIGEERRHNPRLQVRSPEEYAAIMASIKLPTPKLMDIAIPANWACGEMKSTG